MGTWAASKVWNIVWSIVLDSCFEGRNFKGTISILAVIDDIIYGVFCRGQKILQNLQSQRIYQSWKVAMWIKMKIIFQSFKGEIDAKKKRGITEVFRISEEEIKKSEFFSPYEIWMIF